MNGPRCGFGVLVSLLLAGCAGAPIGGDGPPHPERIPDLSAVPEPTPRAEPRSRYGNPDRYEVFGRVYHTLDTARGYRQRGTASWYGTKFHGRRTSSGEPYDMYAMTAAHTTLPLPTYVRVTHLENGRSVVVRVNDRGPFVDDRIIDLSYAAAHRLGMLEEGTAPVLLEAIDPAPRTPAAGEGESAPVTAEEGHNPPFGPGAGAASPVEGGDQDGHLIQVGAFASRDNARRLQARLQARGLGPVSVTEHAASGQALYRVRIGPEPDGARVLRMVRTLEAMGLGRYHVIAD
ncbi:septal ring lytic transglycosylase RlpA family protein [Ectothiorhodospira mobilis]|uniref:septal ring lytic transglycosylase RlpA family protein n=1 Tax=Ectothiorhodospira mobilis TaxID=195064 RepID=UPI00190761A5|nr:septal ring lytic transglycosylase RlpA family protein [Ectothiorhodospira mobilis]MBK1691227.1 septal ring lytic transglycosylase RlpA family lipoprotein [Ectothiorhodospira mobilis]